MENTMKLNAKVEAARAMLADLEDEAAALAMAAEQAVEYLSGSESEAPNASAALGTLVGEAKAHLDAIETAYTAAKALLTRARDGAR
jgi:hypothetical protein